MQANVEAVKPAHGMLPSPGHQAVKPSHAVASTGVLPSGGQVAVQPINVTAQAHHMPPSGAPFSSGVCREPSLPAAAIISALTSASPLLAAHGSSSFEVHEVICSNPNLRLMPATCQPLLLPKVTTVLLLFPGRRP